MLGSGIATVEKEIASIIIELKGLLSVGNTVNRNSPLRLPQAVMSAPIKTKFDPDDSGVSDRGVPSNVIVYGDESYTYTWARRVLALAGIVPT